MAKKNKRLSESTMHKTWRRTVLATHRHRCAFCGTYGDENLQCHHIIKRVKFITRWDWKNGIALCHACHRAAHDVGGEIRVARVHPHWDYLMDRKHLLKPDHLGILKMSDQEFYKYQKEDAERTLAFYEDFS